MTVDNEFCAYYLTFKQILNLANDGIHGDGVRVLVLEY